MKLRFFTMLVLSMAFIGFTSCTPQEEPAPSEMVFAITDFNVPADGGVIELKFVPTSSWSAACSESFVSFDPQSGEASEEEVLMTVSVDKNKKEARKAQLVLSFETNDVIITIDQDGKTPKMKLDETEFYVSAKGEDITLNFIPVSDWTAECEADWLSFNPQSGSVDEEVTMVIKVSENKEIKEREAEIDLVFASNTITLTIAQDGVEAPKVTIEKKEFSVPAEGGQVHVEFVPLTKWVAMTEDSFVTLDPRDGKASNEKVTLTVTLAENTLDTKRIATVKVKFEENEEIITISQDGIGPKVEMAQTEYEASWRGDNITLRFVTPVATAWTATCDQNFIVCDSYSAESYAGENNLLEVIVKENLTNQVRTATLKLSFDSNDILITITQQARPAPIVVSQSFFNVPAAGGTVQFSFVGTTDWELSNAADFVECSPSYGYASNNQVTVSVEVMSNESAEPREIVLTLTSEIDTVTVTILQDGKQQGTPDNPDPDDPNPDDPSTPGSEEMVGGTEDVNKGDDINIRR